MVFEFGLRAELALGGGAACEGSEGFPRRWRYAIRATIFLSGSIGAPFEASSRAMVVASVRAAAMTESDDIAG